MRLNIFKLILIIILSNLSVLFVLYYIFPIFLPWLAPRQVFSSKKIEDKSFTYSKFSDFESDISRSYEKAKISSLKILKEGQVVWWAALVTQDWYFVSAKHIFDWANFLAQSYFWDNYSIQNIWFDKDSDLVLWKLVYTGWKLDNFSLAWENYAPNLWSYFWIIGYPNSSTKDNFFVSNLVSFFQKDKQNFYMVDKKLFGWNSGWSVFDINWNLVWIVSSSLSTENFSYILPVNQWLIKNMIAMTKDWKLSTPVLDFWYVYNSYWLAKQYNLDDFNWYLITSWNGVLNSWDIVYWVNWISLNEWKNIFQALSQSQLSGVAKFEILRDKQKSILQVPINFQ